MHRIETKKSDRSIKRGFGKESNKIHKLAPVWIGKEKRRSPTPDNDTISQNKKHYQVEMAYRSGHWRNQKIGSRNEPSSKLIWIKPTVVNYKNTV